MAQVQIQTKLSVDDLIKAINQLNKPELENFVRHIASPKESSKFIEKRS